MGFLTFDRLHSNQNFIHRGQPHRDSCSPWLPRLSDLRRKHRLWLASPSPLITKCGNGRQSVRPQTPFKSPPNQQASQPIGATVVICCGDTRGMAKVSLKLTKIVTIKYFNSQKAERHSYFCNHNRGPLYYPSPGESRLGVTGGGPNQTPLAGRMAGHDWQGEKECQSVKQRRRCQDCKKGRQKKFMAPITVWLKYGLTKINIIEDIVQLWLFNLCSFKTSRWPLS